MFGIRPRPSPLSLGTEALVGGDDDALCLSGEHRADRDRALQGRGAIIEIRDVSHSLRVALGTDDASQRFLSASSTYQSRTGSRSPRRPTGMATVPTRTARVQIGQCR
jgi:hypothetical protein